MRLIAVAPLTGKSGVPGVRKPASTTMLSVRLNVVAPEVPITSNVYVPAGVDAVFEMVKFVLFPGVTGLGLKLEFIAPGKPLVVKVIGLLNPPRGVVLIVYEALLPLQIVALLGLALITKPATGADIVKS